MAINEQLDTLYKLKKELEKSNNKLINVDFPAEKCPTNVAVY